MTTAQEYIQEQLNNLSQVDKVVVPKDQLVDEIVSKILSKKFRKFAVDAVFKAHLIKVVEGSVKSNSPIIMVLPFGGYKLWRISTSPLADWAELFSMIYFARYAKSIAAMYEPGVVFDFLSDDVIVSRMNNIPSADIDAYQESFTEVLKFISAYLPSNVKLVINRVRDLYSTGEFDHELETNIMKLQSELPNGLPQMDEAKKAMVELNVKLLPGMSDDPVWREKVLLMHDAYAKAARRRPYYRNESKLMIVNVPLAGALAIGTTKASVAKFWCGLGILEKKGDQYIEKILSPKQIETTKTSSYLVEINGLNGNNFKSIGVSESG